MDESLEHTYICEACGTAKTMTPQDAFNDGWDYPPFLGTAGTLSPRTCGNCGIDKTLWWRLLVGETTTQTLTEDDQALIIRIQGEREYRALMPPEPET